MPARPRPGSGPSASTSKPGPRSDTSRARTFSSASSFTRTPSPRPWRNAFDRSSWVARYRAILMGSATWSGASAMATSTGIPVRRMWSETAREATSRTSSGASSGIRRPAAMARMSRSASWRAASISPSSGGGSPVFASAARRASKRMSARARVWPGPSWRSALTRRWARSLRVRVRWPAARTLSLRAEFWSSRVESSPTWRFRSASWRPIVSLPCFTIPKSSRNEPPIAAATRAQETRRACQTSSSMAFGSW